MKDLIDFIWNAPKEEIIPIVKQGVLLFVLLIMTLTLGAKEVFIIKFKRNKKQNEAT